MSPRRILLAYLLTSILSACADSDGGPEQTLSSGLLDAESAAEHMLSDALTLNSAVHSAFGRVKAGSASTREKVDKDPIIYSIRRSLEEQQRALE